MENPIMIDLVGDKESQLPSQLKNIVVIAHDEKTRMKNIQHFISSNKEKKILIFTQTK
ncbi:MAG: hypothetical protein ACKO96_02875 [Flammeovirgaceae bacterium]|jgi:superfamily II DNA/RNA helicase